MDDFTRTGAVWVTGTGAFLLVVAAAVFVAVRWDHLPEALKLAVLGALSGSALLVGRRLRGRLPATAAVLYHLGAFLLPVVAAAVALRFDASWGQLLLIEGVVGVLLFTLLERVERSVVLRVAAAVSVVVAALGLGTTAGVAPATTVALAAVIAELTGRRHLAVFWSLMGGLAPATALAAPLLSSITVLDELTLAGTGAQRVALFTGIITAAVLVVEARSRRDLVLLVAATAALALGGTVAWLDVRPPTELAWLLGAAVFLALELAAWFLRHDSFLRSPTRVVAFGSEVAAGVVAAPLAVLVMVAPPAALEAIEPGVKGSVLAATIFGLAAWLVADVRRRVPDTTPQLIGLGGIALLVGSGWAAGTFGMASTLVAGVAIGTASAPATAITMTVLAAVLVLSGRPFGHAIAAWAAAAAVLTADRKSVV